MQIVIDIPDKVYERFGYEYREENCISKYTNEIILNAFCNGTPLPKGHGLSFDEIIDKAVKEIFVQCKQTNPNYSKDWNEGFNDGMFHAITIIKGIRKGEIQ